MLLRKLKPLQNFEGEWTQAIRAKGDVTRDDSQRRFLAQHIVAMLEQCCNYSKPCCNNVVTLCCPKNRRCESITSPLVFWAGLVEKPMSCDWLIVALGNHRYHKSSHQNCSRKKSFVKILMQFYPSVHKIL